MPQEDAPLTRRHRRVRFRLRAHTRERFVRHDEEEFLLRFRENDEIFAIGTPPARRNGDPVLVIDRVAEFAGEESLGVRVEIHTPVEEFAILIHFAPFLTTFRTTGQ